MPHIIVEYSDNLPAFDQQDLLYTIHQGLIATDLVQAHDVKSRIQVNPTYLIGLGQVDQGYIHVQLRILTGRTEAQKAILQDQVLAALQQIQFTASGNLTIQLSSELIEMPRALYRKAIVEMKQPHI